MLQCHPLLQPLGLADINNFFTIPNEINTWLKRNISRIFLYLVCCGWWFWVCDTRPHFGLNLQLPQLNSFFYYLAL